MNEGKRTVTYLAVAALAIVIAWEPWAGRSALESKEPESGEKLFKNFTDPLAASSMRILKYDEDTGTLRQFRVAQVDGVWSIPSHQNYPADAREHLAEAATALGNIEVLSVASDKPGDQELYGVRDPDSKDLSAGATGVGTRVTMLDADDKVLADLIIGKEVKDKPDLRFVREPARDQIYQVAVKTDKLSTKFGDWIEKDLLKLNAFDVRSVELNDYSIVPVQRGLNVGLAQLKRSEIKLEYDDAKAAWKLDDMIEYEDGKPVASELGPDEELNSEKLNALKTALDDLQIVDVERKPKGLKGLQFIDEVADDQQSVLSLKQRGFIPAPDSDGKMQVYSKEGEAICQMKDGVEYVLRFGEIAGGDDETADGGKDKPADAQGKKDDAGSKVNRYLFVMAQFNPNLIPKPKLETLPGDEPADGEKADDEKADDKKAADENATAEKDKSAPDADKKAGEKTADEQAAEEDAAEHKKVDAEKRATIERDNKRKQTEYDEKVKKGEEHVKELNKRFADWYYIISDDVYHKIHLSRADVVKTKEKKAGEGDTSSDLKELEEKGLRK